MAYAEGNPKTKKELKAWVAEGREVEVFSPGPFPCKREGVEFLEGPHYPERELASALAEEALDAWSSSETGTLRGYRDQLWYVGPFAQSVGATADDAEERATFIDSVRWTNGGHIR